MSCLKRIPPDKATAVCWPGGTKTETIARIRELIAVVAPVANRAPARSLPDSTAGKPTRRPTRARVAAVA